MKVLIGPWPFVWFENTTQNERRRQSNKKRKHLSFFKYLSTEDNITFTELATEQSCWSGPRNLQTIWKLRIYLFYFLQHVVLLNKILR